MKITLPIPKCLQLKHKSRGNRWAQTARLEGSTWQKRKPRNSGGADGAAHPCIEIAFAHFIASKKFTCCILGCTDNPGDKNGSAITVCSDMVKHWQLIRILCRRSQISYFCLNDTSALTAFLTSCPLEDCVLYPFVYLLCCRNRSYDSPY